MTEPFTQWVIEDHFRRGPAGLRSAPASSSSPTSTPFEHMKLRLLNGSHSALAYLGYLAGLRDHRRRPWPTIRISRRLAAQADGRGRGDADDAGGRRSRRLPRLAARALRQSGAAPSHLADRDGRLAEAAAAPARHDPRPARGRACRSTATRSRVAGWMRYVTGVDEKGQRHRRARSARRRIRGARARGRSRRGTAGARIARRREKCSGRWAPSRACARP